MSETMPLNVIVPLDKQVRLQELIETYGWEITAVIAAGASIGIGSGDDEIVVDKDFVGLMVNRPTSSSLDGSFINFQIKLNQLLEEQAPE